MPKLRVVTPGVTQSVTRPVIVDIIGQLQTITGISKDAKIFYPGDTGKMATPGSTIDSKTEREAIFNTNRIAFIEVDEDYDPEALGTTAVQRDEHIPVFLDESLGVKLTPVYATTNVKINFKYRCMSESEARRWRDDMRTHISMMRDINLHSASYGYALPDEIILILKEIHSKREAFLPYNQGVVDYIKSYSTDRLTVVADIAGQDARLTIAETQGRIQGIFDFEGLPEKAERDNDTGTWSIAFSYKFNYEKPISCAIEYPLMVHNQLLEKSYIDFMDKAYDLNKVNKTFTKSLHAMNAFEYDTVMNSVSNPDMIIRIPSYDDFILTNISPGSGSVLLALCEVDTTDKVSLLNLRELGDIILDEDILQFIAESEYPYIGTTYGSILNLQLYKNKSLMQSGTIICDDQLNVSANYPLNLRNQHRVRLSLMTDITMVQPKALTRLMKYPKALIKIIGAINELLRFHPDFVKLGLKSHLTMNDFSQIYSFLTGYRMPDSGAGYFHAGVNTSKLFQDVDPFILENYRRNGMSGKRVMTSSIIAVKTV